MEGLSTKIFINPGHDPHFDPGAVNERLGLTEEAVARRIAVYSAAFLRDCGHSAHLWQLDNLRLITNAANNLPADAFVSIHCNAYDGSARGSEAWYYYGSTDGRRLAECIQRQIVDSVGTLDRGVKEGDFYVLRNTDMPAALIETAFIDNDHDARLLVDKQDDFARAIARGITDFLLQNR